jgi:EAL domain-containing protein (putative c-di-GMP-specific phosphodiesterase class I)
VETQQQLEFLADRGCDRVQGYLFARPVQAAELLPLVRRLEAAPHRAGELLTAP